MIDRELIGTILTPNGSPVTDGRLIAEIIEAGASDGASVIVGRSMYRIVDGVIKHTTSDADADNPPTLASPNNYRFTVVQSGRTIVDPFDYGLVEADEQISWPDIYEDGHDPVSVVPTPVRVGDQVDVLRGDGGTVGQRVTVQADGSLGFEDPSAGEGDVSGGNASSVGEIPVYDALTGKHLGRSNKTIAQLTADIVAAAVTAIVGGAPVALNTLVELAAALNDDPAQINTILTQLGLRATVADLTTEVNARIADIADLQNQIDALGGGTGVDTAQVLLMMEVFG